MQPHNREFQPLMDNLQKSYEVTALRDTGHLPYDLLYTGNNHDLNVSSAVCIPAEAANSGCGCNQRRIQYTVSTRACHCCCE